MTIPFVAPQQTKRTVGWRFSDLSPCLNAVDLTQLNRKVSTQKIKPLVTQSHSFGSPTDIKVVRIAINQTECLVSLATGQLFDPHTGRCWSSSQISIRL
jgi:hypothetical protein